ncbi:zinc-ribbon domain-containing protein [Collinsella bouchesdurhonensis]|uniref:zinc-ribbon domain-containing protein n=1 Tax=Collinsella bouchesdurhonensis TaxID=1907654 RepID=UPI0005916D8D|nr:zinc-ribbon domain-containing protein [Collinsella bouchesdurhonensis]
MFCSHCGAPMGDNDKFCSACGAPNAGAASSVPQGQPQPQQLVPQPVMNVPKGCTAQAFEDMTKTPGVLQRVCQIAFLPALICVVSVLVLFIPVIGGIAAAIGFLAAYVASVCGAGFGIEWGRDLSLKIDGGMDRPLMRSTSFGLGVFSSVISAVLEVIAAIPVIGVALSLVEGVVIGAAGSYSYYGSYALEAALFGSLGLLVLALIVTVVLAVFFKMFADIAVMHFAVTGRVESAFSLDKVWAAFKNNKTKLFCASFLPEFLTSLVSNVVTWILTAVFGAIAGFGAYSYYYRPRGIEAIVAGGGVMLVLFLVLVAFVTVFLAVFGKMLKHRAVGYWVARYASEWADEDKDDVLTFVLPFEKKPAPSGYSAPNPAPAPAPVAAPAPVPAPESAPKPESDSAPELSSDAEPQDE